MIAFRSVGDDTYRGEIDEVAAALGLALGGYRVRGPSFVHTRASSIRLDTLAVTQVDTSPLSFTWDRETPEERQRFLFCFASSGVIRVTDGVRESTTHGPGLHVVRPGDAPVEITVSTKARIVLFSFHRADASPHTLDDRALDVRACTASPIYQIAFAYLWGVANLSNRPMVDVGDMRTLHDLTRSMARALMQGFRGVDPPERSLYKRALRVIRESYTRPTVGVDYIAEELGVSRRTLERAFAEHDTRISDALRSARARHAIESLRANPARSLRDLVTESGFGSIASLRRAIAAEQGGPLSDVRAASRASDRPRSA